MDTEVGVGELLEMFQQADTQINYVASTLSLIVAANDDRDVSVVASRLQNDMQLIKKMVREIKGATVATPKHLVVLKTGT